MYNFGWLYVLYKQLSEGSKLRLAVAVRVYGTERADRK